MEPWAIALTCIGCLLAGAVIGFFAARAFFKYQLKKNPPINRKTVIALFSSMGRKPSEKQIREVLRSVNKNN